MVTRDALAAEQAKTRFALREATIAIDGLLLSDRFAADNAGP
jgi:hypothetical protein